MPPTHTHTHTFPAQQVWECESNYFQVVLVLLGGREVGGWSGGCLPCRDPPGVELTQAGWVQRQGQGSGGG